MQAGVKGLISEQGRALSTNRLNVPVFEPKFGEAPVPAPEGGVTPPVGAEVRPTDPAGPAPKLPVTPEEKAALVNDRGGPDQVLKDANKILAVWKANGVDGLGKVLNQTRGRRVLNMVTEYLINAMLSGGKTLVANLGSGIVGTIYKPLEVALGGAVTAQPAQFRTAMRELLELPTTVGDSFKLGLAAFQKGEGILQSGYGKLDGFKPSITAENVAQTVKGFDPDSWLGHAVDWIGKTVRLPTAVLQGSDEFVKQMNFRTTVRAQAFEEGTAKGLSGQALADYIGNNIPYNTAKPLAEILQRALVDPAFDLEAAAKSLAPKCP